MSDFEHQEIRRAVDAAVSSDVFRRSQGLGKLLEFLIEHDLSGKTEDLKETYIGWAFYRKPLTYDPKTDSVVRVNATRLRARLQRFYQENPEESIQIQLLPGSYVPRYSRRPLSASEDELLADPILDISAADHVSMRWGQNSGPTLESNAHTAGFPIEESALGNGIRSTVWWKVGLVTAVTILSIGFTAFSTLHASRTPLLNRSAVGSRWNLLRFSSLGGEEEFPAISPKGDQIAFVWRARSDSHPHIYVQNLGSSQPRRLTDEDLEENRPAWSPDGTRVAFIRLLSDSEKEVHIIPASGGKSTKIAGLLGRSPWLCEIPRLSWSPDGKFLYTSASLNAHEPCSIVSVELQTGALNRLTKAPSGYVGDLEPTVSRDGSKIAFLRDISDFGSDIYIVGNRGEGLRRVTNDNRDIMGFAWSSDGTGFVVSSRRGSGLSRLWSISTDGKVSEPLTDGTTSASFPDSEARGNRVAFTAYHIATSIHHLVKGKETEVIAGLSGNSAPQLSPDGNTLVYRSDRTGSAELWISDLRGQAMRRLTNLNGAMVNNPRWSPDGSQILFECRPEGRSDLCIVRPDRKDNVLVLAKQYANQLYPSWSYDGRSIYFSSNDSGHWEIYRQVIGQAPVQITHGGGARALESSDGNWLYVCRGGNSGAIYRMKIVREKLSVSYERPSRTLAVLQSGMEGAWDVTNLGIVYLAQEDKSNYVLLAERQGSATHEVARVKNTIPQGDTVLSSTADGRSFFLVERDSSNGEIDLLLENGQT